MKQKLKANSSLAIAAFCSLAAFTACADVLFAPTAATAQSEYRGGAIGRRQCINAINGNGLSAAGGVVTAKTGHSAEYVDVEWLCDGTKETWIAFDLGAETTITGMHVWNLNEKPDGGTQYYKRGIKTCELRYGDTMPENGMSYADAGEWGRLAEVLTFECAPGTAGYTGEDVKFHVPAKTRYVMLRVLSTHGFGDPYTGLAEVRFYRSPGYPVIPVGATAESVYNNTSYPSRAIDGSGLTQAFLRPYTLGATHDNNGSNINVWLSAGKMETWIAFDLGSEKTVTGFHLWNYNTIYNGRSFGYRGVKTAEIYVAESLPETGTPYGTVVGEGTSHEDMTFAMADGSTTDLGQDYEFATPVRGRYFLFKVTSSHRGNVTDYYTGISEIVFYEQADAAEVTRLGSGSKTIPGGASVSVAVVDGEGGEAAPIGVAADATGVRTVRGEATGGTPQIALADKTLAVGSVELPSWSAGLEITGGSLGFLPEMLGWMELAIDADLTVHSDIASGTSGLLKTGSGTFIFDGTDSRTGFTRFTGGGFRQTGGSVSWAKAEFANLSAEFAGGTSSISAGLQMTNSAVAVTGSHVAQWNEVSGTGALSITNGGVLKAGPFSNSTNDAVTIEIDGGTLAPHAEIGSVPLVPQTKEIAIGDGGATFDTSVSGNAIVEAALKPATENAAGAIRKTGANTLTLRGRMENKGPVSVEAGTLALRTLPAIHYDFDGIVDGVVPNLGAAGSALDGIMANSKDASKKPEAVEGVSGTALRFTDYDVVATRSVMALRQYTFAAWVKAYGDTYGSQRIIIAYDPNTGPKGTFVGYLGTGDGHFMVTAENSIFPNSIVSAQDTENWHHVASTFDGSRILLYVDGVLRYSRERTAFSSVDYTMKLGIGNEDDPARYPTHSYHWNGAIDEVYVFDRALSADEIVALKDGSWAAVNALNPESDLSISADAALDLGGTEQTVATLTLNGRMRRFGQTTWGAIGSGAAHETELITGSGILHVSGPKQPGLILIVK